MPKQDSTIRDSVQNELARLVKLTKIWGGLILDYHEKNPNKLPDKESFQLIRQYDLTLKWLSVERREWYELRKRHPHGEAPRALTDAEALELAIKEMRNLSPEARDRAIQRVLSPVSELPELAELPAELADPTDP